MSRIGDALKRAGAGDLAGELPDLPVADPFVSGEPADAAGARALEADEPAVVMREPVASDEGDAAVPRAERTGRESGRSVPVLSDVAARPDSRLITNPELPAMAVEQYRRLAAMLHHVQEERGIRRVLISSAVVNEGKTLTSANLALTLSHSYQRRVLLIDADLRRPQLNVVFGIPNGEGLSEALERAEPYKLPVVRLSPLLAVLPAGRANPDPMAGLTSQKMAAILDEAAEQFDWVILDSPPVGLMSDAKLLAAMTDAALLVIGAASTPCAAVQRAVDALGRERVLGAVLNRAELSQSAGYYHQYGYYEGRRNGGAPGFLRRLLGRG